MYIIYMYIYVTILFIILLQYYTKASAPPKRVLGPVGRPSRGYPLFKVLQFGILVKFR